MANLNYFRKFSRDHDNFPKLFVPVRKFTAYVVFGKKISTQNL